jgi:anti-sigma regulatory factor (Ser/Thr protein kinase)
MPRKSRENPLVRPFVLEAVEQHPTDIAAITAKKFGITRQSANRYLHKMVVEGSLESYGATKARKYRIKQAVDQVFNFDISKSLKEDTIWRENLAPLLLNEKPNIIDICQYGTTEMINNVIDHSEGTRFFVNIMRDAKRIIIAIGDDGVGIFEKIRRACKLDDPRHAILELAKGKLTTDPKNHSGEGIFFTSRMFREFSITSAGLFYSRTASADDEWLLEPEKEAKITKGTYVSMEINVDATYTVRDIFTKYEDDDNRFTKTHVPVRLARYGDEQLVSRSQARRVLGRFERFSEVLLDFKDVPQIGQAFADEIFRVYRREHPDTKLLWIRANPEVEGVITRAYFADPVVS